MGCARTGWTRARQRRQWAATGAAALAVGCCRGGGTAGSGLGAHGSAAGLRSLSSGRDGEQGTRMAGPGHWRGNGSRQGRLKRGCRAREGSAEYVRNVWRCMALPSFYKAIGKLNGLWESKGRRMPNFAAIAKFLPDFNCKVK